MNIQAPVMTQPLDAATIDSLNQRFAGATAAEIVRYTFDTWGRRTVVASSFGAEDVVLMHLAVVADPAARIFTLDTGRLHQETYEVLDLFRIRFGITFEVHVPETGALTRMLRARGPNSFYDSVENRKECCHIRKVEPLQRALAAADAWMTGLRRAQAVTRAELTPFELDGVRAKVNPLVAWSEQDVWDYIRAHDLPYNALHDRGFPSIGCAPCTRAIEPGEDVRAGRWWWENPEQKECGLHSPRARRYAELEAASVNQQGGGI
jgi:phosphoadenosine phosphosulfate reductase